MSSVRLEQRVQRLPITRELRVQLLAGKAPSITGEGDCPISRGHREPIVKNLDLIVDQIHPRKGGGWRILYVIEDKRDAPRLLRRTPPVVVPEPDKRAPTAEAIKQGAQESSYTSTPVGAITDAGEAVDERTQDRFSREGQQDRVRRMADYERKSRERPLHEQLEDALDEAKRAGVDVTRYEQSIEKRIEAVRRRTRREAA